MKSSRFFLFITGLIVFLAGATGFFLNYEMWFSDVLFWTTSSVTFVGAFLLGMSAHNNHAGKYRSFRNLKKDSFKIIMFKQVENKYDIEYPTIYMLIHVPDS